MKLIVNNCSTISRWQCICMGVCLTVYTWFHSLYRRWYKFEEQQIWYLLQYRLTSKKKSTPDGCPSAMYLANGESFDPELQGNLLFFMLYPAINSWAHIRRDRRRSQAGQSLPTGVQKTPNSCCLATWSHTTAKTVNTITLVVLICTEARSWRWLGKLRPFIKVKIVIRRSVRRLPSATL